MMEIYLDELTQSVPDEFDHNFKYIETIASGSFGTVIRATELETNREVAVKVISKDQTKHKHIHKLKQEVNILKQLKHKNIVEFFGFVETSSKLYIIMEYIHQGTLKSLMDKRRGTITEEEASRIIEMLLSAVEYLHCREICHRDIKPENIMFNDTKDLNTLKLVDFGLSAQYFEALEEFEFCGTLLYMAPEQIEKKTYSKAIDIWSVGIIMFMLLNHGKHPFYRKGDRRPTYRQKLKTPKLTLFYKCSEMAQMLLFKLLDSTPGSRYTAEKALKHPWITRRMYDSIPQTFFETIRTNHIIKRLKTAIGAMIFLSKFAKKNMIDSANTITQDYLNRMEEISQIIKNNFMTNREKSFDICYTQEKEKNNIGSDTVNKSGIVTVEKLAEGGLLQNNQDVKLGVKIQIDRSQCNSISPKIVPRGGTIKSKIKIALTKEEEKCTEKKRKVVECKKSINVNTENGNWGNFKTSRIKDKYPLIKDSVEQNVLNLNIKTSKTISVSPVRISHAVDEKFKIELKRADQVSNSPDCGQRCSNIQKYNFNSSKGLAVDTKKKGSLSISPKKFRTGLESPIQKKYSQLCIIVPMINESSSNLSASNAKILPVVLPAISPAPNAAKKKKDLQILLSQP